MAVTFSFEAVAASPAGAIGIDELLLKGTKTLELIFNTGFNADEVVD